MTRDNCKLHAAFPVHLVLALVAALVLVPFSSVGGASAAKTEGRFVDVEGKLVNLDDPDQSAHGLLWNEGKTMKCFGSIQKADAHAARMDRAARLVKSGRMSAADVEDGVTAASCTWYYRYWSAINYTGTSLSVCHEKADLTWVCDDADPDRCFRFDNVISSFQRRFEPWCTTVYDGTYFRDPKRWTCASVADLRTWGWNDRISSVWVW
jgi:hypothetical protein